MANNSQSIIQDSLGGLNADGYLYGSGKEKADLEWEVIKREASDAASKINIVGDNAYDKYVEASKPIKEFIEKQYSNSGATSDQLTEYSVKLTLNEMYTTGYIAQSKTSRIDPAKLNNKITIKTIGEGLAVDMELSSSDAVSAGLITNEADYNTFKSSNDGGKGFVNTMTSVTDLINPNKTQTDNKYSESQRLLMSLDPYDHDPHEYAEKYDPPNVFNFFVTAATFLQGYLGIFKSTPITTTQMDNWMKDLIVQKINDAACSTNSNGDYEGNVNYYDYGMSNDPLGAEPDKQVNDTGDFFDAIVGAMKPGPTWGLTLGKANWKVNPSTGKVTWTAGDRYDFPKTDSFLDVIFATVNAGGVTNLINQGLVLSGFDPSVQYDNSLLKYSPELTIDLDQINCHTTPEEVTSVTTVVGEVLPNAGGITINIDLPRELYYVSWGTSWHQVLIYTYDPFGDPFASDLPSLSNYPWPDGLQPGSTRSVSDSYNGEYSFGATGAFSGTATITATGYSAPSWYWRIDGTVTWGSHNFHRYNKLTGQWDTFNVPGGSATISDYNSGIQSVTATKTGSSPTEPQN